MRGRIALARACSPTPPDIAQRPAGNGLLEPMPDRAPGAHVLRLLLRPDDFGEPRVGGDEARGLLGRERVELFDASDRDRWRLGSKLVADDVVVELAGRARTSLVTCSRSAFGSSSTGSKRPSASSARVDAASLSRSSPFGVITTSGRAFGSSACRRSRWKYCADVVALTIRMFSWAASWRKRSSLALECSGPLPS